jgi:iron complex outermembrane receptor protein
MKSNSKKGESGSMKWSTRPLAICLVYLFVTSTYAAEPAVAADPTKVITLNIPSEPLNEALNEFSRQTHLRVSNYAQLARGITSTRLVGSFTPNDALTRLLANTRLRFEYLDEDSIAILPMESGTNDLSVPGAGNSRLAGRLDGAEPASVTVDQPEVESRGTSTDSVSEMKSGDRTRNKEAKDDDASGLLGEIVVTGTHIRGVAPSAPMTIITSADIEHSGASTAGEVLRDLPQSFSGGQQSTSATTGGGPASNGGNINFSDSANLRGLGSDSTLVLINGLRVPATGQQNSVDISAIPLAAIDRVEVVTDGASAVYGSDAVGGVVNFILKRKYDGAETRAEVGVPTEGGGVSQRYSQLVGHSWDNGSMIVAYQYRDQNGTYGEQRKWYSGPQPISLLGSIHQNSAYLNAEHWLAPALRVFGQVQFSHTTTFAVSTYPGSTTTDVFGSAGYTYGAAVGGTLNVAGDWQVTATGSYGRDHFHQFDTEPCCAYSADLTPSNILAIAELSADGPIVALPSGELRAAIGGGYRQEKLVDDYKSTYGSTSENAQRHLQYMYGELTVPLVGKETGWPGVERILLTLAGRYEDYSDFGNHFSPKIGLSYQPIGDMTLRATWDRSFHAPSLWEKYYPQNAILFGTSDPAAPSGSTIAIFRTLGNNSLQPETARAFTFGLDYQPSAIPQLRLSATYFNISYGDRIVQPTTNFFTPLLDPTLSPIITLNPSAALQQSVLSAAGPNVLNYTGAPYSPATVGAIVDARYQNIAAQRAQGFDVGGSLREESSIGTFTSFLSGTFLELHQQLTRTSPDVMVSGLIFYPPKYKARGGVSWDHSSFGATGILNFDSGSVDNVVTPVGYVASWVTTDVQGAYSLPSISGISRGVSIRLSVLNAFDRRPPVAAGSFVGFDPTQASPLGRVIKLEVAKKW